MEKEIITRHFNLGEDQQAMAEEAIDKLEKFSPRPVQSLKLTITHEAGQFFADGAMRLKNSEFRAKGDGREPEVAVTAFCESVRAQLAKFKSRISGKQKYADGGLGKAMSAGDIFQEDEAQVEGFQLESMAVERAKESFAASTRPFLVFRNVDTGKVAVIYRKESGDLAHMESLD
ncbi:hypothetical protein CSA17_02070 [bacterium DOLJORAL78_65_58]|nr:MAG: hypothetical protein CSB20_07210 [bacterium DOLZORAL124_64_63]PIE76467.1 MAG: hypothetical protein CSA17_02070 [bacterium DOLJORAL78_65_58]